MAGMYCKNKRNYLKTGIDQGTLPGIFGKQRHYLTQILLWIRFLDYILFRDSL